MVDRYLSLKFGVNPLDGFQENNVYGWMDAHVMTVAQICCAVAQSRAKNGRS